jgi:SAM domain (Sterile alpha motif)
MQQIADWLEKLNLGQYAQRFAENDIDVSVLRHLTDADLETVFRLDIGAKYWQLSPSFPVQFRQNLNPSAASSRSPKRLPSVAKSQ